MSIPGSALLVFFVVGCIILILGGKKIGKWVVCGVILLALLGPFFPAFSRALKDFVMIVFFGAGK